MSQGEIYDYAVNNAHFRVLVVSSDAHNTIRTPWVAPIRHGRTDIPPYLVALVDADPVGGAIDLDRLRRGLPNGDPVGLVTGATMSRVRAAVATVFAS